VQLSLTLLTRSDTFYTSQRLLEAARARGLAATWIDTGSSPEAALEQLRSVDSGGRLPDLVLPRIGSRCTDHELSLLTALEDAGVFSPSSLEGLRTAMDKVETHARLAAAALPTVPTYLVTSPGQAVEQAATLGLGPWVIKPRFGSQGRDVLLARTRSELAAIAREVLARNPEAILQRLVPMGQPRDLRVLVIDGVARAGCWRIAAEGEFRSNVHLGATTEPAVLDEEAARLACAAAAAIGLEHAGVDLVPSTAREKASGRHPSGLSTRGREQAGGNQNPDSYQVLEINGSPGLEGIEAATGRDLAGEVVDWAIRAHARRRATSSRGAPRSGRSTSPCPPTLRP